jgi:hypothetical protein
MIFSEQVLKYLVIPVIIILFSFKVFESEHEMPLSDSEQKVIDILESIQSGSKVLFIVNFGPEAKYELEEPLSAVIGYFAKKDVSLVFATLIPTGIETVFMAVEKTTVNAVFEKERYSYGNNFVHIGFIAGGALGTMLLSLDIYSTRKKDVYGNDLKNLPAMNGIDRFNDFDAVIEFSSQTIDGTPAMALISVYANNESVQKTVFCSSDMVGNYLPFYQAGSFEGFAGGFKSVAAVTKAIEPSSKIGVRYFVMSVILMYILVLILFSGIMRLFRGEK